MNVLYNVSLLDFVNFVVDLVFLFVEVVILEIIHNDHTNVLYT